MNRIERLLDACNTVDGPLNKELRQKFHEYFVNPTPETWDAVSHQPFMWRLGLPPVYLWDVLSRRYPEMYKFMNVREKAPKCWVRVPDVFTVYKVMTQALQLQQAFGQQLDKKW